MSHDLTGAGTSRIYPSNAPLTPTSSDTTTRVTASPDVQAYEGKDTIGFFTEGFSPHRFAIRPDYDTSSKYPLLLSPSPEDEEGAPQPYNAAEQTLVMNFFYKRVKELSAPLTPEEFQEIFNAIVSDETLSDPKLNQFAKKIKEQAIRETRKEGRLSDEWTPSSTNASDWVPSPIKPYSKEKQKEIKEYYHNALQKSLSSYIEQADPPLSPDQINQLREAISTGKMSSKIAEAFNAVAKNATEVTQKAFGLAETWYVTTTNPDDWKPINSGIVTPGAANKARGELILKNIEQFFVFLDNAGNKLVDSNKDNPSVANFRRALTEAIEALKAMLRDIQLQDAIQSRKASSHKIETAEDRQKNIQDRIDKQAEIKKKQEEAETTGKWLKYTGIAVSIAAMVIGGILAIVTFGASAALIVAGIALLTAYSIVDSETNCTQKLMDAFNNAMVEAFPDSEVMQKVMKALVIAVIVAVLIIVIVATGGGAAGSLTVQAAKELAKQMSIQLIMITLMASNALPELFGSIVREYGVSEEKSKEWEFIFMIIMIAIMVAALILGARAGRSSTSGASNVGAAGQNVQQAAAGTARATTANTAAVRAHQTAIEELKEAMKKLLDLCISLLKRLKELPGDVGKAAAESLKGFKDIGEGFLDIRKIFQSGVAAEAKAAAAQSGMISTQKTLQMTSNALMVADGINRGVMGLQVSKLLEEVGDIKETEEILQAVLDMLNKLLHNIQTGLDANSEYLITLQREINNLYDAWSRQTTKIFQNVPG